ncbi:MAG: C25 family cysteine peptidase, partial [Candidatus Eiseniibacteriota bacterium]
APVIPRETDDGPLVYAEDPAIYGRAVSYPAEPVLLSPPRRIRGVDCVILGLTPFRYDPAARTLEVLTELDIRIDFEGGSGQFGEERLRSRWWEPLLAEHLVNYASLPVVDFGARLLEAASGDRNGYEYVIITPDDPAFIAWGDTLRAWRTLEGITTGCFTTSEIGGTSAAVIEAFLNDAYATWDPAPAAFLLLGDYPGSGDRDTGITAPVWDGYCVSDNIYADVDGDDLPDMFHGRITARDAGDLETMIGKMLDYEREPYTDVGFYDHPVFAGGWQTERWFILCTEVCLGYQERVLGKHPLRVYAIYQGTPGSVWSTNSNTSTVVNYFGPSGLGYIEATPEYLNDWSGTGSRINTYLNAGSYMLFHRDHGYEQGWGEPSYNTSTLNGLSNDMYPYVFSLNCLTGKYNWNGECFTEKFHRMAHGAIGLTAASEVSYSFVNDAFAWGQYDAMWPDFMPDYGPYDPPSRFASDLRPGFGVASGKYFLEASSWPSNPGSKEVTYHLFHHHGDAFLRMESEIPATLTVSHMGAVFVGAESFTMQADAGAMIAMSVDGELIGVAEATGQSQELDIVPQFLPGTARLVVTQANHYRHDEWVPIEAMGAYLVMDGCVVLDPSGDGDGVLDEGETAGLEVTLDNAGVGDATGVSATLSSSDPYLVISEPLQTYPDIPMGGSANPIEPFGLAVDGTVPDGHLIQLVIDIVADEGDWSWDFSLPVEAPALAAEGVQVDDSSGNGNGRPDPGETVLVDLELVNDGHSATGELAAQLTTAHPDLVLVTATGTGPALPAGGGSGTVGTFEIQVLPGCPVMVVPMELIVTAPVGFADTLDIGFRVGPWLDDCETDLGWTLGVPDDDATNGQWVREDPVGTEIYGQPAQSEDDHTAAPGTICFVTGNTDPGASALLGDVDDGKTTLKSPVFELEGATSATLSYWRWYTNDLYLAPNEDYWDVAVTADGIDWVDLEHTLESANAWTQHTFELGDFVPLTDQLQLRFVASDYGQGSLVEAAVDDIMLDVVFQASAGTGPVDVERLRLANGIVGISPNPFNPRTSIVYRVGAPVPVELALYDVQGRLVRSLVDGAVVEAGEHTLVFDGRGAAGAPLASGIYFLRFETPEIMQVRQLTLVK